VATSSPSVGPVFAGPGGPWGPPPADRQLYQFIVCDRGLASSGIAEIADISQITLDKSWSRMLSRPASASCRMPSDHGLVNTLWDDGLPIVCEGIRTLKIRHRRTLDSPWVLVFHGIIWFVEDDGEEEASYTTINAFDPMAMFRYRMARDQTGNYARPNWPGLGLDPTRISGPDIIRQMVWNSVYNGGSPFDYEGQIFLDTYGSFDIDSPPAPDLSVHWLDFPMTIADVTTILTDTGVCDVWVDPLEGDGDVVIGRLNAVTQAGNPASTVHFDYGLGDFSIAKINRTKDLETLTNKLRYLLGERTGNRWEGSIEATNSDLLTDPQYSSAQAAINTLIANSRAKYGVFQSIQVHDDTDYKREDPGGQQRPMYYRLWQGEQLFRVEPRELLTFTPRPDAPFSAVDIRLGDIITVNATDVIRQGFVAQQRIYGYTTEIDENAVSSLTQIVSSAE
jgi:hypothetical protein